MLEKTLESPWDCKEIQPVHSEEISPGCSLEGLMLKLKVQYFGLSLIYRKVQILPPLKNLMNLPIHILLLVFIQSVVLTVEISLLLYADKVPVFSLCSHLHPNKTITPQKIHSPILVPPFTQKSVMVRHNASTALSVVHLSPTLAFSAPDIMKFPLQLSLPFKVSFIKSFITHSQRVFHCSFKVNYTGFSNT